MEKRILKYDTLLKSIYNSKLLFYFKEVEIRLTNNNNKKYQSILDNFRDEINQGLNKYLKIPTTNGDVKDDNFTEKLINYCKKNDYLECNIASYIYYDLNLLKEKFSNDVFIKNHSMTYKMRPLELINFLGEYEACNNFNYYSSLIYADNYKTIEDIISSMGNKFNTNSLSLLDINLINKDRIYIAPTKEEQNNHPKSIDYEVFWTGGNNKTQFVQLIYALHEAKLLNDGNGEITKIVSRLSEQLKVGLEKSWPQNHSDTIHRTNSDYSPEIFDKIKDAYKNYSESKLEKKNNHKY